MRYNKRYKENTQQRRCVEECGMEGRKEDLNSRALNMLTSPTQRYTAPERGQGESAPGETDLVSLGMVGRSHCRKYAPPTTGLVRFCRWDIMTGRNLLQRNIFTSSIIPEVVWETHDADYCMLTRLVIPFFFPTFFEKLSCQGTFSPAQTFWWRKRSGICRSGPASPRSCRETVRQSFRVTRIRATITRILFQILK